MTQYYGKKQKTCERKLSKQLNVIIYGENWVKCEKKRLLEERKECNIKTVMKACQEAKFGSIRGQQSSL